jgi:hypothetical protein
VSHVDTHWASSIDQVVENAKVLEKLEFSEEELRSLDRYAVEGGINLCDRPSHDHRCRNATLVELRAKIVAEEISR